MAGIESGIHAPERSEAAKHESGADQKKQSHGDLDRHKGSLQAMARATGAAAAFLEYAYLHGIYA